MRTAAIGLLITALGGLGMLWQVDRAASGSGPVPAALLCPLGGHGTYDALPTWENSFANSTSH